jgi:hypothetical protein
MMESPVRGSVISSAQPRYKFQRGGWTSGALGAKDSDDRRNVFDR